MSLQAQSRKNYLEGKTVRNNLRVSLVLGVLCLAVVGSLHLSHAAVVQTANGTYVNAGFDGPGVFTNFSPAPNFDVNMAAGPQNLVLQVVTGVELRSKTGVLMSRSPMYEFWAPVFQPNLQQAAEGRVLFDPDSQRFFMSAKNHRHDTPNCTPGNCLANHLLAVSKSAAPASLTTADWYFYRFDGTLENSTPTAMLPGRPTLGVNQQVVVLVSHMIPFSGSTGPPRPKIRIFDKSKLIRGEAVGWTDFAGMIDPFSGNYALNMQPALHFDASSTVYLTSGPGTYTCGIAVWALTNPLTNPVLTSVAADVAGSCPEPDMAPQSGTSVRLYPSNRTQPSATTYRNGSLWTARVIGGDPTGSAAIRWYQLNVSSWPSVEITQTGVFGSSGTWFYFPALMVDASNNLLMVYNRSSSSEYVSVGFTARKGTDPPNTLREGVTLKTSTVSRIYSTEWADYQGAALDPIDQSTWFLGAYVLTAENWATWTSNVSWIPLPTPIPTSTPTPTPIPRQFLPLAPLRGST